MLLLLVSGQSRRRAPLDEQRTPRVTRAGPISETQADSIDLVRRVARRDLIDAAGRLSACGVPRADCAHAPLAHVSFGSRSASGMLGGLARDLREGQCRRLVLGSDNTLAMLSSEADELWRGLGDRSAQGKRTSAQRYASVRGFLNYTRHMLRGPAWSSCAAQRPSNSLVA
jgi:hypothetical protein